MKNNSMVTDKQLLTLDEGFRENVLAISKDQFLEILRRIRLADDILHSADRLAFLIEDQPEYRTEAFKLQDQIGHYMYAIDPDEPDLDCEEKEELQ